MIGHNLEIVRKNIKQACNKVGRDTSEVTLLAVSKTKPVDDVLEAINNNQIEFGENKVQEIIAKTEVITDLNVSWHMIGHLQTNKVKYIIDKVKLIHSVDTIKLAEVISKEATKKGVEAHVLVEVNVANEESKFGIKIEEVEDFIRHISMFPNIKVRGLMTIAPFVSNSEENRVYFRELRKVFIDINSKNIHNVSMDVLSMGMTNDYEVAIEEGATIVRVGTGIFGTR